MLPEKADAAYLWDMLDAARAIKEFVSGKTLHDYQKNRMLRGAVERHVEIIGEAANRVSTGFQSSHPEIPWRKVINQKTCWPTSMARSSTNFFGGSLRSASRN